MTLLEVAELADNLAVNASRPDVLAEVARFMASQPPGGRRLKMAEVAAAVGRTKRATSAALDTLEALGFGPLPVSVQRRSALINAMPGTVRQLTKASGYTYRRVHQLLIEMRASGEAEALPTVPTVWRLRPKCASAPER